MLLTLDKKFPYLKRNPFIGGIQNPMLIIAGRSQFYVAV